MALALWTASVVAHSAAGRVLLVARLPGSASALAAAGGLAGAVTAVAFSQARARTSLAGLNLITMNHEVQGCLWALRCFPRHT